MNFTVDGKSYNIDEAGCSVLQGCSLVGIEIPRFCYHEKLTIAGNCRMCLVEISNPRMIKPMASCALPLIENMVIYTNTALVFKAREGVMEFLLANHPLDCPICDQGGECDLQDQSKIFGSDRGRFYENKRSVEDKDWGPFIKTIMTRCIHCTRCIRFNSEISGTNVIGATGRGNSMEVGMYVDQIISSELSGNIIDLCPVGALTSKPYAFISRAWEPENIETLDILDTFGSRIRIDVKGAEIYRVLPSLKENLNEDWITDKIRFCYDGLKLQRLSNPMVKKQGFFINTSWIVCLNFISYIFQSFYINYFDDIIHPNVVDSMIIKLYYGSLIDMTLIGMIRNVFYNDVSNYDNLLGEDVGIPAVYHRPLFFDLNFYENFCLTSNYKYLEKEVSLIFLINFNPRLEIPLFNLKIRKNFLKTNLLVVSIGYLTSLSYKHLEFGTTFKSLFNVFKGKHLICKKMLNSIKSLFFFGSKFFSSNLDPTNFFTCFFNFIKNILMISNVKFSIISSNVGLLSGLSLGLNLFHDVFNFKNEEEQSLCFLFGTDSIENSYNFLKRDFLLYVGHAGNDSVELSDAIFPSTNYLEKLGTFLNFEGRLQKLQYILNPPEICQDEWLVLAYLIAFIFWPPLTNIRAHKDYYILEAAIAYHRGMLREFFSFRSWENAQYWIDKQESFKNIFCLQFKQNMFYKTGVSLNYRSEKLHLKLKDKLLISNSKIFYLSDPISKSSAVMALANSKFQSYDINF